MAWLAKTRGVLVIDDFQLVNQQSFLDLIKYASFQRPPAKLIVITKLYRKYIAEHIFGREYPVDAFSQAEATALLDSRDITFLDETVIQAQIKQKACLSL
jgi:hypothetical protein